MFKIDGENIVKLWKYSQDEVEEMKFFFKEEAINNQMFRRLYIKNVYSLIEVRLYIIKGYIMAYDNYDNLNLLSPEEKIILGQVSVNLNKSGEVKTSQKFFDFEASLKFTLKTFAKIYALTKPDFNCEGWNKLLMMSKRRNDLTHPKLYDLLFIKVSELKETIDGFNWFTEVTNKMFGELNEIVKKTILGNNGVFKKDSPL